MFLIRTSRIINKLTFYKLLLHSVILYYYYYTVKNLNNYILIISYPLIKQLLKIYVWEN